MDVKEKLRQLLGQKQKRRINDPSRVPSAVLVPLFLKQGQYHMLFIKRTETVKVHKGQISFHGGTREKKDRTLLDTALRESEEEIGLHAGDIEVLGELDDEITTTSNYVVTPFVALIPWPYQLRPNKEEVDEIIEIPLTELMKDTSFRPDTELLNGEAIISCAYHYQGRVIWGATARILNKLLDILAQAMKDSVKEPGRSSS